MSAMDPIVPRFFARLRRALALVKERTQKLFRITKQPPGFGSQRMCPFCGLITSRRKPCCLECGKWLKPA
jgi:hypothetical protein